jgi:hypothetical protein
MRKLLRLVKTIMIVIMSRTPTKLLETIERLFKEANGKVPGASSIELEVKLFAKALKSKNSPPNPP